MSRYPQVPLGEVLTAAPDEVVVEPDDTYRVAGIYSFGRGLFARPTIQGTDTKYKTLFRLHAGQFVYSRLKAFEGAVGVVDRQLDGTFVSQEFPQFNAVRERVDPMFLRWICVWPAFWETLEHVSEGIGARRERVRSDRLLEIEIPLPPLERQREIATWLGETYGRASMALAVAQGIVPKAQGLFGNELARVLSERDGWHTKPLGVIASIVSGLVDPQAEPFASLPHINGDAIEPGTGRLLQYESARADGVTSGKFHFPAGSVLYSKIRPYLRKAAQVPFEGVCSADIYAFDWIDPAVDPRFFMYSLIAPPLATCADAVSGRTRMPKLNQEQLLGFDFGYPELTQQRLITAHIDGLQMRLGVLKDFGRSTTRRLEAVRHSLLAAAFDGGGPG